MTFNPRLVASEDSASADLQLISVTKRFGSFVAVDNIDLEVRRGEFLAIMGPSGCGKTTLLRIIAGLEVATTGQLLLRGRDMTPVPIHKRPTRLVWQNYALFPHLDVFNNIAFGLTLQRCDPTKIRERVHQMAELVSLGDFLNRRVGQLSGGQAQRVALARALITEPDILLLDEPLSALDANLRLRMQGELRRLQQSLGISFIYVTHNQTEAFSMADRVAVLNKGRVEQVDAPGQLYNYPRTQFVARFVGMNNIFSGRVASVEGDYTSVASDQGLIYVFTGTHAPPRDANVDVVIQADKLYRSPRHVLKENTINAVLQGREFAGSQHIYLLEAANNAEIKLVAQETAKSTDLMSIGSVHDLFFEPDDASIIGYQGSRDARVCS